MAPILHPGLIDYSGKLKSLVRGKQNYYPYSQKERNHSRMISMSKAEKQNRIIQILGLYHLFSDLYTTYLNSHQRNWWRGLRWEPHTKQSKSESITEFENLARALEIIIYTSL